MTKMKCSMPASRASSTAMLDHRPVDDRQHFLRHRLGRGQKAGAEAGDGKTAFLIRRSSDQLYLWQNRLWTLGEQ